MSPNFGAQSAFRFLAGVFKSSTFTTAGGTLGVVFDHQQRGKILPWFGAVSLFGPMISPVVGGYVGESGLDWRWVGWSGSRCVLQAHSSSPCCWSFLRRMRRSYCSGRPRLCEKLLETLYTLYKGPLDGALPTSLARKTVEALYRPILILLTEPIISVLTAYLAFV